KVARGRGIASALVSLCAAARLLEQLAYLEFAFEGRPEHPRVDRHELAAQPDRLPLRRRLDDGVASDQLPGLGEGSVDDADLATRDLDPGTRGAGQQAPLLDQDPVAEAFFGIGADRLGQFTARRLTRLVVGVALHQHHEAHRELLVFWTSRFRASCR